MTIETSPELGIFGDQTAPKYGDSAEVAAVRGLIADIEEKGQMTPAKRVLTATALALAENIAAGNVKRRAIANEAAQLAAIVDQLTAETGDAGGFTPETKALIDALTVDPSLYAGTPAGHPAQPEPAQPATP